MKKIYVILGILVVVFIIQGCIPEDITQENCDTYYDDPSFGCNDRFHCIATEYCDQANGCLDDCSGCEDLWKLNTNAYPPTCVPECGDGYRNTNIGEECDNGNQMSGDGCSSTCKLEYRCEDSDEASHSDQHNKEGYIIAFNGANWDEEPTYADICIDGNTIREYVCTKKGNGDSYWRATKEEALADAAYSDTACILYDWNPDLHGISWGCRETSVGAKCSN